MGLLPVEVSQDPLVLKHQDDDTFYFSATVLKPMDDKDAKVFRKFLKDFRYED